MIVYGSNLCPNTVEALEVLKEKNISFEYRDFGKDIKALKEFVSIRDENSIFDSVKAEKRIGIPCFVLNNNGVTLDLNSAVEGYMKDLDL